MKNKRSIAVVGQNPKHIKNVWNPFVGTGSYLTLNNWFTDSGLMNTNEYELHFYNAIDKIGKINRNDVKEGKNNLLLAATLRSYDVVISLGIIANEVIDNFNVRQHINLPHPSGLNRKLNDPKVREEIIEKLKKIA